MLVRNFSVETGKSRKAEKGAKEKGRKRDGIQTAELDRRDQVTATNSWPSFLRKGGTEVDYQVAAPTEQVHPTCTERPSLTKECGWKGGDRGGLAQWESFGKRNKKE